MPKDSPDLNTIAEAVMADDEIMQSQPMNALEEAQALTEAEELEDAERRAAIALRALTTRLTAVEQAVERIEALGNSASVEGVTEALAVMHTKINTLVAEVERAIGVKLLDKMDALDRRGESTAVPA